MGSKRLPTAFSPQAGHTGGRSNLKQTTTRIIPELPQMLNQLIKVTAILTLVALGFAIVFPA